VWRKCFCYTSTSSNLNLAMFGLLDFNRAWLDGFGFTGLTMPFYQMVQIHGMTYFNQVHPQMATSAGSPPDSKHILWSKLKHPKPLSISWPAHMLLASKYGKSSMISCSNIKLGMPPVTFSMISLPLASTLAARHPPQLVYITYPLTSNHCTTCRKA